MLPRGLFAAEAPADPHTYALLADTHVALNPELVVRGTNMAANLAAVGKEIIALDKRPAGVFINGDLAYNRGEAKDYDVLVDLLKPMREDGLHVHLTLGNHDDRKHFHDAVFADDGKAPARRAPPAVEDKHVGIVESKHANWFLLDSLNETNKTPGKIGEAQLKWLASALDARHDKPALVMLHHTPHPGNPATPYGVMDTDALLDVLLPRRHVKLYVHGHAHDFKYTSIQDLHVISQPPVAYLFNPRKPNGWLRCTLLEAGALFQLVALDRKHEDHGQQVELRWRS
jgi:3',5'-cyclic AMP phosphodiesterase CpdA